MSTQVTTTQSEAPSIINDMAKRYGMDRRAFEAVLKATVVPGNISIEHFAAFLLVAKQYNLNPITKEIYAFPAKGGGVQPIVGVDGWCNIINSNPQLDGIEFEDVMTDGKLTAIKCRIYRKDRERPTEAVEYMEECKKATEPWNKWPARMLRHKALIQCARYAFSLSGIVDPDEAERMIDVTPTVNDPTTGEIIMAQPSPFKKAAARREFCGNVKESVDKAQSTKEIEEIKALNQPMINLMKVSKSEYDHIGAEDIENYYELMTSRIKIAGATPSDDDDTFTEEEVAAAQASGLADKPGLNY